MQKSLIELNFIKKNFGLRRKKKNGVSNPLLAFQGWKHLITFAGII